MKSLLAILSAMAASLMSMPALPDGLGLKTEPPKVDGEGRRRRRHTATPGAFGMPLGRLDRGIPLHVNRKAWQALRRRPAW